jgi:two-component system, NtrC family, sensor kinase
MKPMKFTHLLAFRLFLLILIVMLAGTAIFTKLSVDRQSKQYLGTVVAGAKRIGDVVERSTNYSMMLNRREDIYHIINTIGHEQGIEAIRIYNKKGEISFSTADGEVGKYVDLSAEACTPCHIPGKTPTPGNPHELTRIFSSPNGYRVLGMITPIYNEPSCSSADCHAHETSQTVLGVLDVMMPLKEIDAELSKSTKDQYANSLLMVLAMSGVSGIFIWLVVNIPVRKLTLGTQEIMKGNLDHRIPITRTDEIGRLAGSFNQMTDELKKARHSLTEWAQTLEQRVAQKTEELRRAQVNMIQVEKMVSLGKLAATVAHELNNPLEGVLTYAKLLKRGITAEAVSEDRLAEIQSELSIIADETARCGNVVKNLLLFSKHQGTGFTEEDVGAIIGRSVKLIDHLLKMHAIKLQTSLEVSPLIITCDPQEIEQALLAIEINAVEAMPEGGTLTISASASAGSDTATISISDTGVGIPEAALPQIFEPFFTTKENGKGTGLGLAVVYGIMQRHRGTINVESKLHEGTTFTLSLPWHQPSSKNGGDAPLQPTFSGVVSSTPDVKSESSKLP